MMPINPPIAESTADSVKNCRRIWRLAGTDGAAQTDLASPFGDAGQHDVHDDDAADNQEDADERHGDESEIAGEVVPKSHDGIGAENGEIVGSVVREMAPRTHVHTRFIFAGLH